MAERNAEKVRECQTCGEKVWGTAKRLKDHALVRHAGGAK